MLRLLHTADSHIGADLPVRRGGRYRRRGEDFVASFQRVLAQARDFNVDAVLHAGDLFDRSRPTAGAIAAATQPLWELAQAGIPVVIVPGNHERSALPDALLLAHPLIHVVRKPQTVVLMCRGVRLAVAGFPCIRRGVAARFEAAVEETGWRAANADVNILLVHQTFVGARCGPGNFLFRTGPDAIACGAVPTGFHYVAAGHVHRHQVLSGNSEDGPPIVYAGSPDRISFAELGEPKGSVLVEFAAGRAQPCFVEHAVRPMELLPLDITGLSGAAVADRVLAALNALPPDAVVQVRITGQATRRALAGLQLTPRIRDARPDLTATVSLRAVEWLTERAAARAAQTRDQSAFDVLDAPPVPRVTVSRDQVGTLPAGCGTYALYDAEGRLLYVGKSLTVRTRVRSHLRDTGTGNHFRGWVRHCARIEVRPAASELEALLVEAELVRRLAPPFNRQMRLWKRYCYLCAGDVPYGQLIILPEPPRGRFAFGPLRSRAQAVDALEALATYFKLAHCPEEKNDEGHALLLPALSPARLCARYFADQCAGPCGGRAAAQDYEAGLRARDALLLGLDTPETAALQQDAAALEAQLDDNAPPPTLARARLLQTLVTLHGHARLLRAAREHLNRPLILLGLNGANVTAIVTEAGLRLTVAHARAAPDAQDACAQLGNDARTTLGNTLPKAVADCLCAAVHHLRRRAEVSGAAAT